MTGRTSSLGLAFLAAAALAACGSEQTFTAQELVDRVKDEGVELRLGKPLVTTDESQELYEVHLRQVTDLPGSDGGRVSGSLSVSDDGESADGEMASCEAAADLLCYRAANVVIVLEGGGIEAQQLGVAIERLSED